jgi:hypothetical protein
MQLCDFLVVVVSYEPLIWGVVGSYVPLVRRLVVGSYVPF